MLEFIKEESEAQSGLCVLSNVTYHLQQDPELEFRFSGTSLEFFFYVGIHGVNGTPG